MDYMRDSIEDEYGIRSLQDKILKIAVYIDTICREHGIQYCLMGGSALGALRHDGFIPWDDDLDIFMTPDAFEKFRTVFNKQGDKATFYLQQLMHRNEMIASAKLRLNHTAYIEEAIKDWNVHQGIFVDIFILHNCPNNRIGQFIQCVSAKYILAKGQSLKSVPYSGLKKYILAICKHLPRDFGIKHALKQLYKYNEKSTDYTCHFMGKAFFTKGIYKSEWFEQYKRVPFEKVELCIAEKAHEYLTERFGEYMKLPPKESIQMSQHAWKWDVAKDFAVYCENCDGSYHDEVDLV